jgi:hypothetical protein
VRFLAIVALPSLIFSAAFRHLSGLSTRAVRRVTQQFTSEVILSPVEPLEPRRMLHRLSGRKTLARAGSVWRRHKPNGLLRTLPPLMQEHPRMTAQLPDTMKIAHFDLPRLFWGRCCRIGVRLPPFFAKAHLLLE